MENIIKMLEQLPEGFEKAANETGAITRKREIKTAADLLLLVFLYVCHGLSLLEVSVIAKIKGIAIVFSLRNTKRSTNIKTR